MRHGCGLRAPIFCHAGGDCGGVRNPGALVSQRRQVASVDVMAGESIQQRAGHDGSNAAFGVLRVHFSRKQLCWLAIVPRSTSSPSQLRWVSEAVAGRAGSIAERLHTRMQWRLTWFRRAARRPVSLQGLRNWASGSPGGGMWKRASADSSGDRSNSKSSKLEDGSRGGARRGGGYRAAGLALGWLSVRTLAGPWAGLAGSHPVCFSSGGPGPPNRLPPPPVPTGTAGRPPAHQRPPPHDQSARPSRRTCSHAERVDHVQGERAAAGPGLQL